MPNQIVKKIGIDFGGVLSIHDNGDAEHKNTFMNMPNALSSLEQLKNDGHELYLISFCGKNRAIETHQSIKDNNADHFIEQYYVSDKKNKSQICKKIGCHFMIDDQIPILDNVRMVNPNIITILFGQNNHPVHKCAKDWSEALKIICESEVKEIKPELSLDVKKLIYNVKSFHK